MSEINQTTVKRRDVLRGAAAIAGAVALESSAIGQVLSSTTTISVAYFDGTRLVPADRLAKGDSLEQVLLSIEGHGKGALHEIGAIFDVKTSKGLKPYRFKAWEPGSVKSQFSMPAKSGLKLDVAQKTGKKTATNALPMAANAAKGYKLKEGTYVIAAGNVNWSSYRFEADDANGPVLSANGRPTSLGYVLLTVERA